MKVDNLFLEKLIGKGSFGEVYLTKRDGDNKIYATKIYDRTKLENSPQYKYLENEINILVKLKHPNIVKFVEVKKTNRHYYIVMEYCNGGELMDALEKYKLKYGKPFPEELVQYLMRQIISAFKYIHGNNAMHRDIKLQNILLNYESEEDKKKLNIMKAQVKIIDFGFACQIGKDGLRYSTLGNALNMDPVILKKLTNNGKIRQLGYDKKADIWSLGAVCYQMLIGKAAFDADDMDELIEKIEKGKYRVPTTLSREVVSFLNGMLQYDSKARLTADQLNEHPFLRKDVKNFRKINLNQVSNKIKKNQLEIDTKNNKTIWSIFNKEDEEALLSISPDQNINNIQYQKTVDNNKVVNNMFINNPQIKNFNTYDNNQYININNYQGGYNRINNPNYGPILPRANQGIPGNPNYRDVPNYFLPMPGPGLNVPMSEPEYVYRGNIYNK